MSLWSQRVKKIEILEFEDVYKFFMSIYMFKALQQRLSSTSHNLNSSDSNLVSATFVYISVSLSGPKI